jgi:hypothetical protein
VAIEFVEIANPGGDPDPYVVAVDRGADGDMQLFKLAYSADGVETLVPATANGLHVIIQGSDLIQEGNELVIQGSVDISSGIVQVNGYEVDGSTFTPNASKVLQVGGAYESTPSTVPDNDLGVAGITSTREWKASDAGTHTKLDTLHSDVDGLEAKLDTIIASMSVIDDWDASDRAMVNPIVGQAGIAAGTGVDGATVPRMTLATNVGLPAGTNNIGDVDVLTLPALPTGTNNIGDVDVLTVPADPFGANADAAVAAGATGSIQAKLRRISSDLDAVKTSVEAMDDWDETNRAAVNPISGQAGVAAGAGAVSATVQRVTHASDDPVTTSVQLIDDVIATDDTTTHTPATTKAANVAFVADDTSTDSVDEGDIGMARMTLSRMQITTLRPDATGEGLTPIINLDIDESEDDIKTSPGKVYGWDLYNLATSNRYVRIYNATAANTTVGSTAALCFIPMPPGAKVNIEFTNGIKFDTAICIAATTGFAANDTGAPGTNEVMGTVYYQ